VEEMEERKKRNIYKLLERLEKRISILCAFLLALNVDLSTILDDKIVESVFSFVFEG